jgi:hypothetical protein
MTPYVEYKKIEPQTVEVWNKDGFFARVNEHELYDIRLQIKNQEIDGFYVVYDGMDIRINIKGQLEHWPVGFFDLTDYYLQLLLDWGTD